MRLSNYPDGMSEGDIPNYWDTECPTCEDEGYTDDCPTCEGTGVVDTREWNRRGDDDPAIDAYLEARNG